MAVPVSNSISELVAHWHEGPEVHERLMPLVYRDLRQMAANLFIKEKPNHTLPPTALVTEAYIRLCNGGPWINRAHFFGAAANAMRQTLVDHARRRRSLKRGRLFEKVPWDDSLRIVPEQRKELLGVDLVIRRLSKEHPRQARIVELRYFAGLNIQETAEALNVSTATVRADWTRAKTRLKEYFSDL